MQNEFNEKYDNVLEDGEDTLADLLNGSTTKENNKKETVNMTAEDDDATLSPLERLKKQRALQQKGMVISKQELEEGRADNISADMSMNDDRLQAFADAEKDLDETLRKRAAVIVKKIPNGGQDGKDGIEFTEMMMEIDAVRFDANGKPYINLVDSNGNHVEPKYIRIRTENDPPFDPEVNEFTRNTQQVESNESNNAVMDNSTNDDNDTTEVSDEKKKIVQVIIDKTGYGTDFAFTEAEKEKISSAETIQVREVKKIDIAAIKAKRSEKSFQDIIKEYDYKDSRSTICFPASGFKAQMKALTYGEYSDVALSMENITVDIYYKRLSVIYNKMTNISSGPFKDFEDFLKSFAYTDIPLALYGMYMSTEDDVQDIQLACGTPSCKQRFNWKFNTRSLIRLDQSADVFLDKLRELASADASDYENIRNNSIVMSPKYIELPESKFIVELGIASAYEFLYNFIPLLNEDKFREEFGDLTEAYLNNIMLLTSIRSINIPADDGYIECTGYKDILDAIYNITPTEIQIINTYAGEIQGDYNMVFSFGDVKCPHCGSITKNMVVSMDDLVFQTYQRLMTTEIKLETMHNS